MSIILFVLLAWASRCQGLPMLLRRLDDSTTNPDASDMTSTDATDSGRNGSGSGRTIDDGTTSGRVCELNCQNGGDCEILTMTDHHKNVLPQRCVCPPGYGGLECEVKTKACYRLFGVDRYCQSGTPCTLHQGAPRCDCRQGYDLSAFAGIVCEHSATEYCTESSALSYTAFCTNGGACKTYVENVNDQHPGCDCVEGFEGKHCEFLKGETPPPIVIRDNRRAHDIFVGILITMFGLSLLTLMNMIRRWYVRKYLEDGDGD